LSSLAASNKPNFNDEEPLFKTRIVCACTVDAVDDCGIAYFFQVQLRIASLSMPSACA